MRISGVREYVSRPVVEQLGEGKGKGEHCYCVIIV